MTSAAQVQTAAAAVEPVQPVRQSHVVLQTIAHELRQPLSAMESIGYYLSLVLPRGEARAREHASKLQDLVQQANWILNCGLQLADPTPLSPEPLALGELITQAVAARAAQGDREPLLQLDGDAPLSALDPARARALIDNLLSLFHLWASEPHPVRLRTEGSNLHLSTTAPGYGNEASLGSGSALALLAARTVVAAHQGQFTLTVDPAAGIQIHVEFPPTVLT